MKKQLTKQVVLSGLFIAIALLLPFLTAQNPVLGRRLLPMHLPVLLCGFVCGWPYGLIVGLVSPVFRSLLFGMPPMFPTAVAMSFELAAYGCITGLLHRLLPKNNVNIFVSLISAMIGGRIVWGIVSVILYGLSKSTFTWQIFVTGAFIDAIPGIVLQIILIPIIVVALKRARVIDNL